MGAVSVRGIRGYIRRHGHKFVDLDEGYIMLYMPEHPFAKSNGTIREHRLVMEQHLQRYLKPDELVHHINGIKTDNRIENLQLMSRSDHISMHHRGKRVNDSVRSKLSKARKTRIISEETKAKTSKSIKEWWDKRKTCAYM